MWDRCTHVAPSVPARWQEKAYSLNYHKSTRDVYKELEEMKNIIIRCEAELQQKQDNLSAQEMSEQKKRKRKKISANTPPSDHGAAQADETDADQAARQRLANLQTVCLLAVKVRTLACVGPKCHYAAEVALLRVCAYAAGPYPGVRGGGGRRGGRGATRLQRTAPHAGSEPPGMGSSSTGEHHMHTRASCPRCPPTTHSCSCMHDSFLVGACCGRRRKLIARCSSSRRGAQQEHASA